MKLTQYDHDMIHHAANRRAVTVVRRGHRRAAILVAWKPWTRDDPRKRRNNVARVQFTDDPNSRATVKCSEIEADPHPTRPPERAPDAHLDDQGD